ncbi:hypothetical protein LO762_18670 [Actinocorallia sp. API 0066]|uniref:hypothetical protein n=1 Tax=Actinocorallia sp. API 0066 TaxID=2896846 RepID=UPI001E2DE96E|nr:hypothetical protein [Actinocorallia sp. API 0066]MCD0451205.1 hypothetical protein [Actinocorallia sp. API 0066]
MPRGAYLRTATGAREEFQCAPGPAGWRYVAPGVDLTVDSRWRPVRLELRTPDWTLRGGCAGREVLWVRGDREHTAEAHGFLGESPGFLVAVARSLRLEAGGSADVPLVVIEGAALATRLVAQRWSLLSVDTHETDLGPLPVEHWRAADLQTAEARDFHLAGDVVLAADGLELESLESPPNL